MDPEEERNRDAIRHLLNSAPGMDMMSRVEILSKLFVVHERRSA